MNKLENEDRQIEEMIAEDSCGDVCGDVCDSKECSPCVPNDGVPNEREIVQPEKEQTDYTHWYQIGTKSFYPSPRQRKVDEVPAGVYSIEYDGQRHSYFLYSKSVSLDELFVLSSKEQGKIIGDIQSFWKQKAMFTKYKFVYKRGILLHGPAGCGKSSIINLMSKEIVQKYNGIVIYLYNTDDLRNFVAMIPILKQIEPNKQILCVLEDLETFTSHRSDETLLLNILDGANQMDNIVYLGTTNYIEQLKERIINRPSRFDRRYYIGTPNAKVRKAYFKAKILAEDFETFNIDLDYWVKKTAKLSISHLGEVIKSVLCLGNSFDDVLNEFEEMKKQVSSASYGKSQKTLGFGKSNDEEEDYDGYEDEEEPIKINKQQVNYE